MIEKKYLEQCYYKYIPLQNIERLLDIIVRKRLYGATYRELNDPMEGKFDYSKLCKNDKEKIFRKLSRLRICSLLQKQQDQIAPNDFLMWSHYADGHKGCCLEIQVVKRNNQNWELLPVRYTDQLAVPTEVTNESLNAIVSTKANIWKNEHEVRAIRWYENNFQEQSKFVAIKINAIYLGARIPSERCKLLQRIISALNSNIKVYKMKIERESITLTHLILSEL